MEMFISATKIHRYCLRLQQVSPFGATRAMEPSNYLAIRQTFVNLFHVTLRSSSGLLSVSTSSKAR